jgi:hypothetical protein
MNRVFASAIPAFLVVASMFVGGCVNQGGDATTESEEDLTAKSTGLFVATSNEPAGGDIANITQVKRANSTKTKCADGKSRATCSIVGLDFSALGLSDSKEAKLDAAFRAGHAILQGKIQNGKGSKTTPAFTEIVVSAAWMGAGGNDLAAGDQIYSVGHLIQNFMCLNGPCATINETLENTTTARHINNVDLDGVGASNTELGDATDEMKIGGGGLLVGGFNATLISSQVNIGTTSVTTLNATDFYLPVN